MRRRATRGRLAPELDPLGGLGHLGMHALTTGRKISRPRARIVLRCTVRVVAARIGGGGLGESIPLRPTFTSVRALPRGCRSANAGVTVGLCESGLGRPGPLLGGRRPLPGRAGLAVPIQSKATIEEAAMAAACLGALGGIGPFGPWPNERLVGGEFEAQPELGPGRVAAPRASGSPPGPLRLERLTPPGFGTAPPAVAEAEPRAASSLPRGSRAPGRPGSCRRLRASAPR